MPLENTFTSAAVWLRALQQGQRGCYKIRMGESPSLSLKAALFLGQKWEVEGVHKKPASDTRGTGSELLIPISSWFGN